MTLNILKGYSKIVSFRCFLNTAKSSRERSSDSSAFHSRGAADMKDLSASILCLVLGTSKVSAAENRRL